MTTATITRWWGRASAVAALALLALFLYLDGAYKVFDAFPLKHHPPPPSVAFLLAATACFPIAVPRLFLALRERWLAAQSRSWPTVQGTVLRSDVDTYLGPPSYLDVRYEYTVDGRRYESRRIFVSQRLYRYVYQLRSNAEEVAERFPLGSRPAVHYDPDDPSIAVLDTSVGPFGAGDALMILMLLAPLLGFSEIFRWLLSTLE